MSALARRKYLERYAEPEARFARQLRHQYAAAVVVPLHRENDSFLERLVPAASATPGRVLVIAVVNATDSAPGAVHVQNERLLRAFGERLIPRQELSDVEGSPARAVLGRPGAFDLLVIDRASAGRRLPPGEGVGLSRRIGMDVALALHDAGGVVSPWLGSTDADAQLPDDYLATLQALAAAPLAADGTRRVGLSLPFWHVPCGNAAIDEATILYEISLRYYTLGLSAAGSPYAYQSLGSALSVHADGYADVRGVPRRQAGEDFYLLDKLAKIGSVHRPRSAPVLIRSRASDRVPFGTGPRVREVADDGGRLSLYHPRAFELLGLTLRALRHGVVTQSEERVVAQLGARLDVGTVGAISTALEELQAFEALRETFGASSDPRVRERRLLTWFDALRTLRFVHLIEAPANLPRLPVFEALARASFTPPPPLGVAARDLNAWRRALADAEQALPPDIGAESVISGAVNIS